MTEGLSPKQIFERRSIPYTYFLLRPVSRVFVPHAARLGMTPNQVTSTSIMVTLIGTAAMAVGGIAPSVVGVLILHLGHLLDLVDGDLARLTGKASRGGEFLDALGGYLRGAFLLPAIGIGIAGNPDAGHDLFMRLADVPVEGYVYLGLVGGLIHVSSRLVSLRYRTLIGQAAWGESGSLGRAFFVVGDLLLPALAIGSVLQYTSFVLVAYALLFSVAGVYVAVTSYARAVALPVDEG